MWEPKKINFNFHRIWENTGKMVMCKISFCEIWSFRSLFSQAPIRTFSLELFHTTYYSYKPWKVQKKNAICLKLFWYTVFVHWKLKLFNSQSAKKVSFTACHSGKLKLAFTSTNVISTSPKNFLMGPLGKLRTKITSLIAKSISPGLSDTTFFECWESNVFCLKMSHQYLW